MKRNEISDEVREDAAILCAAMADWWGGWPAGSMSAPRHAWQDTEVYAACAAACDAVRAVVWIPVDRAPGLGIAEIWREAGGLIVDGWCPGDPVHRRKVSP